MAKSYSGLDKTEAFFAHYGRKGMKRGMNIYNPDYKPVGEKAKFTNEAVPANKIKTSGIKIGVVSADDRSAKAPTGPQISVTGVKRNYGAEAAARQGATAKAIMKAKEYVKNGGAGRNSEKADIDMTMAQDIVEGYEAMKNSPEKLKDPAFAKKVNDALIKLKFGNEAVLEDNSTMGMALKVGMLYAGSNYFKGKEKPQISVEGADTPEIRREREQAAKDAAANGAATRRQKLMEAERKRQANIYRR